MSNIELPTQTEGKILTYLEKIAETPTSYYDTMRPEEPETMFSNDDPTDPTVPGITEEFILNKDKTTSEYKGIPLDTNAMSHVFPIVYPPADVQMEVIKWAEEYFGMTFKSISGRFHYPQNGGFMGWHTNADTPGKKIYVAYATEDQGSFFRYYDNEKQEVVTDWDKKGLNIRSFDISVDPEQYYWHCVYAYKSRISYGFYLV